MRRDIYTLFTATLYAYRKALIVGVPVFAVMYWQYHDSMMILEIITRTALLSGVALMVAGFLGHFVARSAPATSHLAAANMLIMFCMFQWVVELWFDHPRPMEMNDVQLWICFGFALIEMVIGCLYQK